LIEVLPLSVYSCNFANVGVPHTSERRPDCEGVEVFIFTCSGRVLRSSEVSVVTVGVLQQEVRVKHLCKRKHAQDFVSWLALMDELMSRKSVNSTHVPPDECKHEPASHCVAVFAFKPILVLCALKLAADYTKAPNPSQTVVQYKCVYRTQETFVL
jgi:hypothetical protein